MSQIIAENQLRADASAVLLAGAATAADGSVEILTRGRERGVRHALPYAGAVTPREAWVLFSAGSARLVDVRSAEEIRFVGRVPEALHVAWMNGLSLSRNPRFTRELEASVGKDEIVVLLCRSGKRSAAAAEAATRAGFNNVFNVLEGFEGDLDEQQRRGAFNGWRFAGLPWVQD